MLKGDVVGGFFTPLITIVIFVSGDLSMINDCREMVRVGEEKDEWTEWVVDTVEC